jgi:nucleotide-binding universal stress UspA family protein
MAMRAHSRPIVVPLDGSKNAEFALPVAARLARLTGAPVELVYVVDADEARAAGSGSHPDWPTTPGRPGRSSANPPAQSSKPHPPPVSS